MALNQEQFLNLIYALCQQEGITASREELRPKAIRWSMRHPGRTPRVAQQFVRSLGAESHKGS
jgi:predicted AAA+ superfamily ATPase